MLMVSKMMHEALFVRTYSRQCRVPCSRDSYQFNLSDFPWEGCQVLMVSKMMHEALFAV